jgi:hypothetical protein
MQANAAPCDTPAGLQAACLCGIQSLGADWQGGWCQSPLLDWPLHGNLLAQLSHFPLPRGYNDEERTLMPRDSYSWPATPVPTEL